MSETADKPGLEGASINQNLSYTPFSSHSVRIRRESLHITYRMNDICPETERAVARW